MFRQNVSILEIPPPTGKGEPNTPPSNDPMVERSYKTRFPLLNIDEVGIALKPEIMPGLLSAVDSQVFGDQGVSQWAAAIRRWQSGGRSGFKLRAAGQVSAAQTEVHVLVYVFDVVNANVILARDSVCKTAVIVHLTARCAFEAEADIGAGVVKISEVFDVISAGAIFCPNAVPFDVGEEDRGEL